MCLGFPVYGLSLYDFMKNNHYAGYRMDDLQFMTVSIFRSMEFLHNNCRLIHTDLKPENILFKDVRYYEEGRLRRPRHRSTILIDFGRYTASETLSLLAYPSVLPLRRSITPPSSRLGSTGRQRWSLAVAGAFRLICGAWAAFCMSSGPETCFFPLTETTHTS